MISSLSCSKNVFFLCKEADFSVTGKTMERIHQSRLPARGR
jgi:hypothetical protein